MTRPSQSAMTLVEMMVATAIGSIAFLALASLTLFSARSFSSLADYSDLNRSSRMALDRISREIRQSRGLLSATVSPREKQLVFRSPDGNDTFTITYEPPIKLLKLKNSDGEQILSKDCVSFKWQLFQRNPQPGSFDFTVTTNPSLCKMVQIDWNCARDTQKSKSKSQSAQSMKIVIRKRPN